MKNHEDIINQVYPFQDDVIEYSRKAKERLTRAERRQRNRTYIAPTGMCIISTRTRKRSKCSAVEEDRRSREDYQERRIILSGMEMS